MPTSKKKFQSNFQFSVWAFIIVYRYSAANVTKDYSIRSILGLHLPHPISCGALCQINCDTKTRDVNLCDVGSTLYTELGNILCFWAIPNRHERTLWLFKVLINKKPIKKKALSAQKEETIHFFSWTLPVTIILMTCDYTIWIFLWYTCWFKSENL